MKRRQPLTSVTPVEAQFSSRPQHPAKSLGAVAEESTTERIRCLFSVGAQSSKLLFGLWN